MKKTLFRLMALSLMTLSLASCKKDKEDANLIEDSSGLKVSLNWTVTTGNALDTDLDLYLYQGTTTSTEVAFSNNDAAFESFNLPSSTADGDYTLTVDHWDVMSNGSYTLTITGVTNTKTWELKNVGFTTSDNTEKAVVRINKSGNKYTLTKL